MIRVGEFVFADSEFSHPEGERPARSSCFVAHEERSRRTIRAVRPGIGCRIPNGVVEYGSEPPWAHGPTDLFSAFSVGAEMGSYFNEGWPYPANIICTFAEMMTYHNTRLCKAGEGSKEVPNLIRRTRILQAAHHRRRDQEGDARARNPGPAVHLRRAGRANRLLRSGRDGLPPAVLDNAKARPHRLGASTDPRRVHGAARARRVERYPHRPESCTGLSRSTSRQSLQT